MPRFDSVQLAAGAHQQATNHQSCEDAAKCAQCAGNHSAGSQTCSHYKYEQEVIAIQSKEHVSYHQAKLILNRINPNLKRLNYSEKLKDTNHQRTDRNSKNSTGITQVVCQSPSGRRFVHEVQLERDMDGTSESNPGLRAEAIREFKAFNPPGNDQVMADLNEYEDQLRIANRKKKRDSESEKVLEISQRTKQRREDGRRKNTDAKK